MYMQAHEVTEELFTRLEQASSMCKNVQMQVPLYLEHPPVKYGSHYAGYNPLKNPYIGHSVINLSPPQVFIPPYLIAPFSNQRFSQWGIKMYLAGFQEEDGKKGGGQASGGGTAKGHRVHRDEMKNPAKMMKR